MKKQICLAVHLLILCICVSACSGESYPPRDLGEENYNIHDSLSWAPAEMFAACAKSCKNGMEFFESNRAGIKCLCTLPPEVEKLKSKGKEWICTNDQWGMRDCK